MTVDSVQGRPSSLSLYGLRLDDAAVRVAVGLHLYMCMCGPHTCQHYTWTPLGDTPLAVSEARVVTSDIWL